MVSPRSLAVSKREGSGNQPYTLPELDKFFINSVTLGDNFVTVLDDLGAVFIFDDCMELIKLPVIRSGVID